MSEKHGAIWIDFHDDNGAKIVLENYEATLDKLFVIYERMDGNYMPFSFVKQHTPQWSTPIWNNENTKVLMNSLEESKSYLTNFYAHR